MESLINLTLLILIDPILSYYVNLFPRIDAAGKTRSKTRTLERKKVEAANSKAESLPSWTFDGSSTGQVYFRPSFFL